MNDRNSIYEFENITKRSVKVIKMIWKLPPKLKGNHGLAEIIYIWERSTIQKQPPKMFYKKGLKAWNFIKKGLQHRCSHVNITEFLRTRSATKSYFNVGIFLWILRKFQEDLFWRTSARGCFLRSHRRVKFSETCSEKFRRIHRKTPVVLAF